MTKTFARIFAVILLVVLAVVLLPAIIELAVTLFIIALQVWAGFVIAMILYAVVEALWVAAFGRSSSNGQKTWKYA